MTRNLWCENSPAQFWLCQCDISEAQWDQAITSALHLLPLKEQPATMDALLKDILGEGQFGSKHWQLSSVKKLYYNLKSYIPRPVTCQLRRLYHHNTSRRFQLDWPIESRYGQFQWEIMRQLCLILGADSLPYIHFWPRNFDFAFVLTHDIETAQGQEFVRAVADLEESLNFRSSFNFVPERYRVDYDLTEELVQRGFEVGVHGLKHDDKLFSSHGTFMHQAAQINRYLQTFNAVGFRSPYTLRHPEWMQCLNIEYDLSFFDTDPFEPIPGGTMSIWPYFLGHFIELPYTLVQDYSLVDILGETTPDIWLRKVDFIQQHFGMALVNTHPDYLRHPINWKVYVDFLDDVAQRKNYWHALPREVARWWRERHCADNSELRYFVA